MGSHVADLEAKITQLGHGLRGLGDASVTEELLTIVHKPGWTTVAEASLVAGMVEALHAQAQSLQAGGAALLEAARQVGAAVAEATPRAHAGLETKIKEMGDASLSDALLAVIHRPGWTTPAEALLVMAMVDSQQAHVLGAQTVGQTLLAGARQVGTAEQPAFNPQPDPPGKQ